MKLLIATTYRGVVGGTESYLFDLLPALQEEGFELGLLYDFDSEVRKIDDLVPGIPRWCTHDPDGLSKAFAWNPERCYSQGMNDPETEGMIANAIPTILFSHGYYATCATGMKFSGWGSPEPCERVFGPACLSVNYLNNCRVRNPLRLWQNYCKQRVRLRLLARYKSILAASNYMVQELARHSPHARPIRCQLFLNDSAFSDTIPKPKTLSYRILFSGRLVPEKGGSVLVEAVAQCRGRLPQNLTIDVAGTGQQESELRRKAQSLGVSITFHGWLDRCQLNRLRDSVDLVAVPSLWPEPFGLVGIESGARGLPAVGFAVGGIPDWLISGYTGELAPARSNHLGLADAICSALQSSEYLHRLRVGAWEQSTQFSRACHVRSLAAILRS